MIGKSATKLRLLQMINIKNCVKIVNGSTCPCANKLRLITLRIPLNIHEDNANDVDILKQKIKYNKCFMEDKYIYHK